MTEAGEVSVTAAPTLPPLPPLLPLLLPGLLRGTAVEFGRLPSGYSTTFPRRAVLSTVRRTTSPPLTAQPPEGRTLVTATLGVVRRFLS